MEDFFNFGNELFECDKQQVEKAAPQFTPLYFSPKDCDGDAKFKEDPKLYKQYADYLYFKGEYSAALLAYQELRHAYQGNLFMAKCVQESEAWCLAKLGRADEAEAVAQLLTSNNGPNYNHNIIINRSENNADNSSSDRNIYNIINLVYQINGNLNNLNNIDYDKNIVFNYDNKSNNLNNNSTFNHNFNRSHRRKMRIFILTRCKIYTIISFYCLPYSESFQKGLFETNGRLKDPDKFGFWVTSCNQLFVFGKSLVTWRENNIKCASIGMQPIEIGNDAKYQCFKELAINWKYGSNYWTSGLRTQGSKFSWCTKNGSSEMTGSVDLWAPGQPDNLSGSENCVHLNIKKENTTVYLTDKKCTNINVFSCQGPTTPPPPCSSPVCPNITCKRNMSLYTNSTKEGKTSYYLTNPDMFGSWYKKNSRFYFYSYSNQSQTFLGAMKACCDLGMNLLSLQFDYKFDAVIAGIKERYANPGNFWTSGTDSGCESTFGFCAVKRLLRKDTNNWQPGQPNNAGGAENHLVVFINGSSALMADFNGDVKLRYICESRDTSNSDSAGKSHPIRGEIDNMLNNTNYDLRMKCFIKCIGENSGLMIDGKFIESEVLAILEKLAVGNLEDLKKNLMIVDECSNSSGGMDECDKAAQMIKCTNEKAPDVLMSVVNEMERSISQSESSQNIAPLRPQPTFCVQDYPCFVDSFLRAKYDETTTSQEFDIPVSSATNFTIDCVCGKKYLLFTIYNYNYNAGNSLCCKFGLRLATLDTLQKIECVFNSSVYGSSHKICNFWIPVAWRDGQPRWCFSNSPLNDLAFDTSTLDPSIPGFIMNYNLKKISSFDLSSGNYAHVLCEDY
ncbi:uncharacterized protein LOC135946358 [Cloeon dipterum]|uniref:uncharacterized protein LOC135946358 n=1 Tax=Cloeon dipterum TaxID=197152 RepID=UPI00321FB47E